MSAIETSAPVAAASTGERLAQIRHALETERATHPRLPSEGGERIPG